MKELEVYKLVVDMIDYANKYILSSFPKNSISLKIKFNDNLYFLLDNVIRANVNSGSIRNKYQKEILINVHLLDYYIEVIKKKSIITTKRYLSFINKLNNINKLVHGWIKSETSR